jgi:hypothetical protein
MWLWHLPAVSIAVTFASVAAYASLIWGKVLTDDDRAGMRSLVTRKRLRGRMESEEITH